jgi:hypothetical protein
MFFYNNIYLIFLLVIKLIDNIMINQKSKYENHLLQKLKAKICHSIISKSISITYKVVIIFRTTGSCLKTLPYEVQSSC